MRRVTSFMLGVMMGAVMSMYMNRTNKMMLAGFSNLSNSFSKLIDRAMMSFADRNMPAKKESDVSLDQVQSMIERDPKVKAEVDQIISENRMNTH